MRTGGCCYVLRLCENGITPNLMPFISNVASILSTNSKLCRLVCATMRHGSRRTSIDSSACALLRVGLNDFAKPGSMQVYPAPCFVKTIFERS